MTWKITLAHIDDKTGEYVHVVTAFTDQQIEKSDVKLLEVGFQELTDKLQLKLKEQTT